MDGWMDGWMNKLNVQKLYKFVWMTLEWEYMWKLVNQFSKEKLELNCG